jgi:hypothetical protein
MVVHASGSSLGQCDGDEDAQDERKEKKRMQDELSRLQAEVEDHKRHKQDMYLKLLQEQERRDKAESNLRLEQVRNAHNFAAWEHDLKKAKEELSLECAAHQRAQAATKIDLQTERNKRQHAQNATAGLHAEIDHLHDVNATITSDLEDLRGIESEAATKHRDDHLGLPPAYGNLDDEDRFPPYSTHEDAGTIEVAHLKQAIRAQFDVVLTTALANDVEKRCKLLLLGGLAGVLSFACNSLQKLLDMAPKVPVSRVQKPFDYGGYVDMMLRSVTDAIRNEGEDSATNGRIADAHPKVMEYIQRGPAHTYLPGYKLIQEANSAPYVADRIARLLLELLWRCAAACELRPGAGTAYINTVCTSELVATVMLHFTQVDSVLVKALQLATSRRISTSKLQYHLTQLERLNVIFKSELYEQIAHRQFFGKATEWLNEQVEKLRSMPKREALKLAHPEKFREEDYEADDDTCSDHASSRWHGSDSGSENDDHDEKEVEKEDEKGDENENVSGGQGKGEDDEPKDKDKDGNGEQ